MQQVVRLLHVSDLHMTRWPTLPFLPACDLKILREVCRIACGWSRRKVLDAVLISGDLADSGTRENIDFVSSRLFCKPQASSPTPWLHNHQPTLLGTGKPIVLVPGNHDRFKDFIMGLPGSKHFDEILKPHWMGELGGVQRHLLPNEDSPVLTIMCADFSLGDIRHASTLGGHWGQGRAYPDRVKCLVRETKKARRLKIPVVWMMHFAPGFRSQPESLRLIHAGRLLETASHLGVDRILCGHTHLKRTYRPQTQRNVYVHCAGTAACWGHGQDTSMHVLDFCVDGRDIVQVRQVDLLWDSERTTFWPQKQSAQPGRSNAVDEPDVKPGRPHWLRSILRLTPWSRTPHMKPPRLHLLSRMVGSIRWWRKQ